MRCPFCGHFDTAVKDSRHTEDQSSVRRRRFCTACGSRFTTFERIQLRELTVLKRNGQRVPFDRDKLAGSVLRSLHKRTLKMEDVERIVSSIIRRLETTGDGEVHTNRIGEMVMEALINLDPVAYVRFASIYHHFTDVNDFVRFISHMTNEAQNVPERKTDS